MFTGRYKIKKQVGEFGFFGELEVAISESERTVIHFSGGFAAGKMTEEFKSSIRMGVYFALGSIRQQREDMKEYSVSITHFRWMIVDTTPMVMAFVAARAVFEAFGMDSEYPRLGQDHGEIVFQK